MWTGVWARVPTRMWTRVRMPTVVASKMHAEGTVANVESDVLSLRLGSPDGSEQDCHQCPRQQNLVQASHCLSPSPDFGNATTHTMSPIIPWTTAQEIRHEIERNSEKLRQVSGLPAPCYEPEFVPGFDSRDEGASKRDRHETVPFVCTCRRGLPEAAVSLTCSSVRSQACSCRGVTSTVSSDLVLYFSGIVSGTSVRFPLASGFIPAVVITTECLPTLAPISVAV